MSFAAAYYLTARETDVTFIVGTVFFLIPFSMARNSFDGVLEAQYQYAKRRIEGLDVPRPEQKSTWAMAWWFAGISLPFVSYFAFVEGTASMQLLSILLALPWVYAGPLFHFRSVPGLGSLTIGMIGASPALFGLVTAGATFTPELFAVLAALLLWGAAGHALGEARKVVAGGEQGADSISTLRGARGMARFAAVLYGLAGLSILVAGWPTMLLSVLAVPYIFTAIQLGSAAIRESPNADSRTSDQLLVLGFISMFAVGTAMAAHVML